MYPQMEEYRDTISLDRADTYHLDLPKQGKLSFILLKVGADHNLQELYMTTHAKWLPHHYITDIDLVANGQKDIISLNGKIAKGLAFLDQGVTPPDISREYISQYVVSYILLNFGGKMWDPNHYLQCEDFDSLELRFTNDMGTTEWEDTLALTTYLGWLRGAGVPASRGFLKREVYRRYTTAEDGYEYIDLPVALPIRKVLMQPISALDSNGVSDTGAYNVLRDVRLTFRSGAITVFDGMWWDLAKLNALDLGQEVIVGGEIYHETGYGFDVDIGEVRSVAGIAAGRGTGAAASPPTISGAEHRTTQHMKYYEGDIPVSFLIRGQAYQNLAWFNFDMMGDLSQLLDPSPAGQGIAQLELHTRDSSSAADGVVRVVLERLATPATL